MNARYYVGSLNRFLSADTIVPDETTPQTLNRYSYVNNNPINFTDPSGHCAETPNGRFDDDCWAAYDYIHREILERQKYIVVDGVFFDIEHAETNWWFAHRIYSNWDKGRVYLEWSDGYARTYEVDSSLTGEERDRAAYSLWLDFVNGYEQFQANKSEYDKLSAWSVEDLPSNYLGFISYVKGSRDPKRRLSDIAHTVADFATYNVRAGNLEPVLGSFGKREGNIVQNIIREASAAIFGAYGVVRNKEVTPLNVNNGFVPVPWPEEYAPPTVTANGWERVK